MKSMIKILTVLLFCGTIYGQDKYCEIKVSQVLKKQRVYINYGFAKMESDKNIVSVLNDMSKDGWILVSSSSFFSKISDKKYYILKKKAD